MLNLNVKNKVFKYLYFVTNGNYITYYYNYLLVNFYISKEVKKSYYFNK